MSSGCGALFLRLIYHHVIPAIAMMDREPTGTPIASPNGTECEDPEAGSDGEGFTVIDGQSTLNWLILVSLPMHSLR